ncbi:MAG: glycosyltransferase family 9 protein [Melioribacteraceae bacterium]|nr:glycosyltransferase family 9 protein [Melioribacteraceae bacterium]MCF8355369.1 glycosyltransferase family 9 protein [Melioribacteraceae bacterium]MCF8396006.1 glycosyltransferase family 9 protein [Melioribacteraceae bacterium]MCF8420250.1 glycosyltransferase family 9 protein [Melioribacteraceae bacterium]
MQNNFDKILIIRLSSLGDVLLTSPFVRGIKQKYPASNIDFLVRQEFSDTVKFNPNLNNIFTIERDKDYGGTISELKNKRYDLVIDLQNNFRSQLITVKLKTKIFRFNKPNIKKMLLVNFKWNLFNSVKEIPLRYAETLPGIKLDEKGLELFVPGEIKPQIESSVINIGFAPGSKHFSKMWPAGYFIELGNLLSEKGKRIILFGGKDDKVICAELEEKIKGAVNLCTDNDLLQTAADMKQCSMILCNDSGLMHTACAVDVPVIAIFGSTVKEFGFAPYNVDSLVIENNSLTCRPCSHIGRSDCPKKHFKCMLELTPGLVLESINKFQS